MKPTREEVEKWIETGDWGGEGMEPLIDNACRLAKAYLADLDEIERLRDDLNWYQVEAVARTNVAPPREER